MALHKDHKVRLSVDCSEEERMYIKMLAAKNHMTISEYLLSLASREMPKRIRSYVPNEETARTFNESQGEEVEIFESLNDFWNAMGIQPYVED